MPDLLQEILEAHGGLGRWQAARELVVEVRSGGFALASKLKTRNVARYEGRISTREPHMVFTPYPRAGRKGVFAGEAVRIESDGGELLAERRDPRALFFGRPGLRRKLWWDDLDLLHFAGYAMWNYLTTPFLFTWPGIETREIEPWEEAGERWRRLAVTFPSGVPTHSREQVFHFDERGLLRRLDYTAEVFGRWARAAHYCHDHREFSGLVMPTRRHVLPRRPDGRPRARPTLIWIAIDSVAVVD